MIKGKGGRSTKEMGTGKIRMRKIRRR